MRAPDIPDTTSRSALASRWLTTVLVLAAAVLAVLVALEVHDAPGSSSDTPAPLTGDAPRARLQAVAARVGERVLTYHHDSFDRDVESASARLTAGFAREYAAAMERVRSDTVRDEIDQETTAVASGVVSATETRAEVLLFVNQDTTSATTGARRTRRDRLVVTLVRRDGAWTVAGVTALG